MMFIYIENLCIRNKLKYALTGILFILVGICSFMNYHEQSQEDINSERKMIAQLLIDNGYTKGYSRFRNANIMTELTNGEMEVWCWNEDNADIGKTYHYVNRFRWFIGSVQLGGFQNFMYHPGKLIHHFFTLREGGSIILILPNA